MKRVPYVICLSLLLCSSILAQSEAPRVEIFGGYSHSIGDAQGWNASIAVNAKRWGVGAVADFSGLTQKESEEGVEGRVRASTYLFGPQFSYRGKRFTPFARALFGVTSINANATGANQSLSLSDTRFSHAAGGGLDIRVNRVLSIRAIQADYIHTTFFDEGQINGRVSFGIVLRFGGN